MTNMLESIDALIEYIRSILSSKSSKNECSFKLNNINTDAVKCNLMHMFSHSFHNLVSFGWFQFQ